MRRGAAKGQTVQSAHPITTLFTPTSANSSTPPWPAPTLSTSCTLMHRSSWKRNSRTFREMLSTMFLLNTLLGMTYTSRSKLWMGRWKQEKRRGEAGAKSAKAVDE